MLSAHIIFQDTTVVALARDPLGTVSAWAAIGMVLAFLALLLVLVMILNELRQLSRSSKRILTKAEDRSGPLIDSVSGAARNVEYITQVLRSDVERLNRSFSGLAKGVEEASLDVQARVKELTALLELAQSEAEDAVLDAATRVRTLRQGAGLLRRTRRGGREPDRIEEARERGSSSG